ncbi:MAG: hypothetical protein HY376_00365 [Candidatus Blackburnbacteria bacterium]|nr:hypothetical protein [Candidatus Blackburnbacteria bacterium]
MDNISRNVIILNFLQVRPFFSYNSNMGVIKPPWEDALFEQYPFNYCDHFGDKSELVKICIICRETQRSDENDISSFSESTDDLAKVMRNLHASTEIIRARHAINFELDDLGDKLYTVALNYGDQAKVIIEKLKVVPSSANKELVDMSIDALLHSENFVSSKIRRAITSFIRETDSPVLENYKSFFAKNSSTAYDSKISALLACVALERNAKALFKLYEHPPLYYLRSVLFSLSQLSLDLADQIHKIFFPKEELFYLEFGADSYNNCFK